MKPLAIDLFCGLGGWAHGFLGEGYSVIGFDVERHQYGDDRYPGQLVLQDVRTIHGSQLKNVSLILASPPCTEYSYMAMPWKRSKQIAAALVGQAEFPAGYTGSRTIEELNSLFNACFRIQREASEAAGHHIPMVIENVCGAQKWVGRAKWHYGSFYLWGDVPALMPFTSHKKLGGADTHLWEKTGKHCGNWSTLVLRGVKQIGSGEHWFDNGLCGLSSKGFARKAASAQIAKIPEPLARHIARTFKP